MIHNTRRAHHETVDGKPLWHEGHGMLCACASCLAYDLQFTDAQVAEAWKYSAERIIALQVLPSGNVVLYDYERRPFYIGDWFGVAAAYEARPEFVRTAKMWKPTSAEGINLSSLDITL